jgi:uroporphyrinogen-III synthase
MSSQSQTVIICKLGDNGQALQQEVNQVLGHLAINCEWHPLQKISFNTEAIAKKQLLPNSYDGLIVTSKYAVKGLQKWLQNNRRPNQLVYAIGPATSKALQSLSINADCVQEANSEALLSGLAANNQLSRHWLICKGESGRDLLETNIKASGGQVDVWSVYCREDDLQQQQLLSQTLLNTDSALFVCTNGESLAILKHIIERLDFSSIQVIVPSDRLVVLAKSLGFETVWNSSGPMNHSIIQCIKQVLNLTT